MRSTSGSSSGGGRRREARSSSCCGVTRPSAEPAAAYAVQSLERAASLLLRFTAAEPELTIGDLARRSNLPRSTVHRLVVNLVRLGFLTRDARSERYRLGLLLAELGTIALSRMGSVAPAHSSATGTVLLAYLREADVRRIAAHTGLYRHTGRTITQVEPLIKRLAEIRRRGFSIDDGETEEGLTGLAAPAPSASGDVQAALVIAGPGERILGDDPARVGQVVIAAANDISASLGYQTTP
jgi:IclR family transcriptional regulator, KDG regulon repressor